jgi:thiamine biosynthesis lipoprotein
VLNIGGDLVVRGAWTEPVGVVDPRSDAENDTPADRLLIKDRAVATSGNYRRGFEIGGRHYSHIIDPRTGATAEEIVSATVISPRPADAGAMATAFCVLAPEESRRVAESTPGTDFLLITRGGKRIASAGWSRYETSPAATAMSFAAKPVATAAAPQSGGAANDGSYELTVNVELAQLGGFARRPYLAVWIEDKDKFPVRTIALWYQKERWLPDLRAWYRDDRMRAMAAGNDITSSVASATRPAGKYSLKWDGKDNAGKPVKAGKYTVCIDAAREHGTYQIIRQEVELNSTPRKIDLPGNQEISNASLDYHKAVR